MANGLYQRVSLVVNSGVTDALPMESPIQIFLLHDLSPLHNQRKQLNGEFPTFFVAKKHQSPRVVVSGAPTLKNQLGPPAVGMGDLRSDWARFH
ncbi:hypothetical protein J6590_024236 [Homalodisca vitripennis]|nr:hypothetical protein J6590_024236 [Homalodisca vitripennis]